MSRPSKSNAPAEPLDAQQFLKTDLGRSLLEIAREMHANDAQAAAREADRQAREASDRTIESALCAEREALATAGLVSLNGTDTEGHIPSRYYRQPVVLLNTNAHPSALVAAALARAERAQAFAQIFEQMTDLDNYSEAAAFALARMIEEVVGVLQAAVGHSGVINSPTSTVRAA